MEVICLIPQHFIFIFELTELIASSLILERDFFLFTEFFLDTFPDDFSYEVKLFEAHSG
jgi:hypothetical protein